MKKSLLFTTVCLILFMYACKNELEVVNPESETVPLIYAILDPSIEQQYIKVQKPYITESSPEDYINNPEYIFYNPSEVEVYLEKYYNNNFIKKIIPTIDTINTSGSNVKQQPIYIIGKSDIISSGEDNKYISLKLYVKDLKTGKIATGNTKLLDNFKPDKLITNPGTYGFASSDSKEISWYSIENGVVYNPIYRTIYTEYDNNDNFLRFDSVDFNLGHYESKTSDGLEKMRAKFNTESYFLNLSNQISINNEVKRKVVNLKIIIAVAQKDFLNYIDINSPSNDLNQEKPVYTNITNGLGLFTNRFTFSIYKELDNETLNEIKNGNLTKGLRFY